jgi:hypothetical protein
MMRASSVRDAWNSERARSIWSRRRWPMIEMSRVPGEGLANDALRRVESDERRAGDAQHRLDVVADVRAILPVHPHRIAESQRSVPPGDVVIAGHADDLRARDLRALHEGPGALKFPGTRALRDVPGNGDDVRLLLVDHPLDRLVLLRHCRMSKMEIRAVQKRRDAHPGGADVGQSAAMTASVNSSVLA